jgi:hypothetical protein
MSTGGAHATCGDKQARRTLPSVTVRSVSINSSHFSTPSRSLISSSHDMAISTMAWMAPFNWPCFLLKTLILELSCA